MAYNEYARKYKKNYREKNKEKLKKKAKKYYYDTIEYQKSRKAKYREENKEKARIYRQNRYKEKPEISRQYVRTRRAKRKECISIPYAETEIFELYGTDCHICNGPIDFDASRRVGFGNWQLGFHIDHLIPIAYGGPDTLENVRPSHALCNLKRGAPSQP